MKPITIFSLILISIFFQNCKPDEPLCLKSSCLETQCKLTNCNQILDSITTFSGHQTTDAILGHYKPDFNPNNSEEFVYVRDSGTYDAGIGQLVIYNKTTKEERVIFQTGFQGIWQGPKWSSTGWIAFSRAGNQIWVIKDTGEDLKQLIFDNAINRSYTWSPNGKRLAFFSETDFKLHVFDSENKTQEIIDSSLTPNGWIDLFAWSPNEDKIAYAEFTTDPVYIGYINIQTGEKNRLFDLEHPNVFGIDWIDEQTIIWSGQYGLYTMDITTQEAVQWREHCDNISYRFPSVSSSGNVLVQYHERSLVGDMFRDSIREKGYIYELILDTCSEWEIEMD